MIRNGNWSTLVRVLALSGLRACWERHPAAEEWLRAWRARVAELASSKPVAEFDPGVRDGRFLAEVARLSVLDNGPLIAGDFLAKNGICLVVERHLPRTHLDGAALRFEGLPPVVALTLRHDRIDSFWFTLCHELAHVLLHLRQADRAGFLDDLDVADTSALETEADRAAGAALIPDEAWSEFSRQGAPSRASIVGFARRLRVHPAVVAGRCRREAGNYSLFTDLVGNGQVRRLFER